MIIFKEGHYYDLIVNYYNQENPGSSCYKYITVYTYLKY